jgi:hypothetical protein
MAKSDAMPDLGIIPMQFAVKVHSSQGANYIFHVSWSNESLSNEFFNESFRAIEIESISREL